jgi:hypothetical protein
VGTTRHFCTTEVAHTRRIQALCDEIAPEESTESSKGQLSLPSLIRESVQPFSLSAEGFLIADHPFLKKTESVAKLFHWVGVC